MSGGVSRACPAPVVAPSHRPVASPRLVGYVRCSTAEQAASGLGLDAQRRAIAQYAELYGVEIGEVVVDDGRSAASLDRPGIRRVLELLDAGAVAGVIVARLDRLTRSVRDVGELVDRYFAKDRRLVSVGEQLDTSTAAGRLVLNVLASVGQWEREAIAERTRAALRSKRERGERAGALPFGYELDPADATCQRLRPCKREQAAIRDAVKMRAQGMSQASIAEALTRRHPEAARGGKFHQPMVCKLPRTHAASLCRRARQRACVHRGSWNSALNIRVVGAPMVVELVVAGIGLVGIFVGAKYQRMKASEDACNRLLFAASAALQELVTYTEYVEAGHIREYADVLPRIRAIAGELVVASVVLSNKTTIAETAHQLA